MSDDTDGFDSTPTDGMKGKQEPDFERETKKGPISPVNEDLFLFLDGLFSGEGEFPEKIEVRTVKGRNKDQYGVQVKQYIYKNTNAPKPSREKIVMMTNEIVHRCKIHTDVAQRESNFIVGAMHHARSDDFYEIMELTLMPSKKWRRGERGDLDPEEPEDFANHYNKAFLGHITQMFGLFGAAFEGLVDRSDRQAAAASADAEKMRGRYIEMLEMNLRLMQASDDRQERIERSKMWRENVGKGLDLAWGLLPPMLSSFKGNGSQNGWQQGMTTAESYTLEQFFKLPDSGGKLTVEQFELIFGKMENGVLVAPGALTLDQTQLLGRVAAKEICPDKLDDLLPGGPLEIKQEQIMKILQGGIPLEALLPLKTLLDVRMAKQQEKNQKGEG